MKSIWKRICSTVLALILPATSLPAIPAMAAVQPRAASVRYAADSYGANGQTRKGSKSTPTAVFTYSGGNISALNLPIHEITITPSPDSEHPDAGGTYTSYCLDHGAYGAGDGSAGEYRVTVHSPADSKASASYQAIYNRFSTYKNRLIAAIKQGYDSTDTDWNHKPAFQSFYGQSGKPDLPSIYAYAATKMAVWSIMFGFDENAVGLKPGIDERVLEAYRYIMDASQKDATATASDLSIKVEPIDGEKWKEEGEYKTLAFAVVFADETALNRIDTGAGDNGKIYLADTSKVKSISPDAVYTQYDNLNSVLNDGDKITRKNEQYRFKLRVPKDTDLTGIDEFADYAEIRADWDEDKMASLSIALPPDGTKYQPYLMYGGPARSRTPVNLTAKVDPWVPPDVPTPGPDGETGAVTIHKVDRADKTKGLAGAMFSIQSMAANYSANGVTGADGSYSWKSLPFATKEVSFEYEVTDEDGKTTKQTAVKTVQVPTEYVVTEISAPQGYQLPEGAAAKWQFTLDPDHADTTLTYTFEDEILLGDLEIKKVDARDGGTALSGAAFTITHVETGRSFSGTTGSSGTLKFTDIPTGVYTIHEDAPPEGYVSSGVDQSVVVTGKTGNTPTSITITNGSMAKLKIRKVDRDTGEPLAGAQFHVTRTDGETVGDYTSGADGYAELTGLVPGSYTVTETKAPSGYVLDAPQQNIVLNEGDEKTITFQDSVKPQIIVRKISAKGAEPLPGAVLLLSTPNGQPLRQYTTDENGEAVISGLTPGSYVITEVTPPSGYLKNEQKYTVEVKAGDAGAEAAVVTITDQEIPGFLLRKVDALTGKPLSGARFSISKPDVPGSEKIYTTNDQGTIFIKEDEIQDTNAYVVKEIEAPAGYILNETPTTVRLEPDKLKTLVWKNEQKPGLHILKTDAQTGAPLNGAVIRVSRAGGDEIGTYTTGAGDGAMAGEISIPNLEPGVYQLEEITAPNGYDLDPQRQTVTLQAGRVAEVSFTDTAKPGLQILKTDETTKQPLAGARFSLKTAGDRLIGEFVTDSQGRIFKGELSPGVYKVQELEAPKDYLKDDTIKSVTLTAGQTSYVTFSNRPKPELEIRKVDEYDGTPLGGAVFRVTRADGSTVGEYTTDTDGRILIPKLEPGVYTIEETKAPQDYLRDEEKKNVTLEWGKTTQVIFRNRAKPEMRILKTDELSGSPLAGAVFKVQIKNGKSLGSFTSDENGLVELGKLEPGLYVITEIKAPDGYNVTNLPQEIQLDWGDKKTVTVRDKALSPIYIKKTDAKTGGPVAGAVFRVQKMNGDLIGEYTTDRSGFIAIPRLDPGWYVVTEISAPDGYQVDNVPKNVELKLGVPAVVEFSDKPHGNLVLKKLDAATWQPLANAVFRVETAGGDFVGEYRSDSGGDVTIPQLTPGSYKVTEVRAPDGYIINSAAQTVELKWGATVALTFTNSKISGLTIKKIDADSKAALPGAVFTITRINGEKLGRYTSDENGLVTIPELEPGDYVVTEIQAPQGYVISTESQTVTMKADQSATLTFTNKSMPGLTIKKIDAETKAALPGALFAIARPDGTKIGEYETDENGLILLPELQPGEYVLSELKAPAGYVLDTSSRNVFLEAGKAASVTFTNRARAALQLQKIDAVTGKGLAGAKFRVTKQNGAFVGEFTTDAGGLVNIPDMEPGWYVVTETEAPDGYRIDSTPQTVEMKTGAPAKLTFLNQPVKGLQILKLDEDTRKPLPGAVFTVEHADGRRIGEFTSDENGLVTIAQLEPGEYVVTEVRAPDGYIAVSSSKRVTMEAGKPAALTFTNKKLPGLTIMKVDAETKKALPGAVFAISRMDGTKIGDFETDENGLISIPNLQPGEYAVSELKAPTGYVLDTSSKTVVLEAGKPAKVTFTNRAKSNLLIEKVDVSGKALSGAVFRVTKQDGSFVGEYTTGGDGMAIVPKAEPGWYTVTEIRAPEGYLLDPAPRQVELKANTPAKVTIPNDAVSGLQIRKVVTQTGEPVKGVTFRIDRQNGEHIGEYTTDANGMIYAELEPGVYTVTEIRAPSEMEIDRIPRTVEVRPNVPTIVTFENTRLSSLRIRKVDADTGKGIYGVRILVKNADNEIIGMYTTDQDGCIELDKELPDGLYKLEEIEAAPGYDLDRRVKTIRIKDGKTTDVEWENAKTQGQIQIIKKSLDANPYNGKPAESLLEGAVFEITNADTGRVVTHVSSDYRGVAASGPLPIGRYKIREVGAPPYYQLNPKEFEVKLRTENDVVQVEVYDRSVQLGTEIKKTGNANVNPGQQMRYDFTGIANTGSTPLQSFYWHDAIPSDVTRLNVIKTGTYSEILNYRVTYRTNLSDYRTLADGLSTTQSYDLDCSPARLGLMSGEYITDFRFEFGQVSSGFHQVSNPAILVTVSYTLPNGYRFSNRADVGGLYLDKWITSASTWVTTVVRYSPVYPKTGY